MTLVRRSKYIIINRLVTFFSHLMGNRRISADVKMAAIRLWERDLLSLEDILDCVGFSRSTFFRVLRLYHETGDVVKPPCIRRGRPRSLHFDDVQYLLSLVNHRPDWFLDEFLGLLEHNHFISVHYTTIHRELVRAGISLKKLKKIAKERNEDVRADFIRRMAQYVPEELLFLDKVSKDERTPHRRCGRDDPRKERELQYEESLFAVIRVTETRRGHSINETGRL
jgi:transposase